MTLPGRLSQTNTDNLRQWRQSSVEWCVRHGTYLTWPDNYHEIKWQSPSPGYTETLSTVSASCDMADTPCSCRQAQSSCAHFNYHTYIYANLLFHLTTCLMTVFIFNSHLISLSNCVQLPRYWQITYMRLEYISTTEFNSTINTFLHSLKIICLTG